MGASTIMRPIGGVIAVLGGILLIATWGIYTSLWTVIGVLLGAAALFGGGIMFKDEYVRGGTFSLVAAIVSWGLYPTHPLSGYLLAAVSLMAGGGVIGLVLELTAD